MPQARKADLTQAEADRLRLMTNPADLVELVGGLRGRGVPTDKIARARRCQPYEIRHLQRLHSRLSDRCKELLRRGRISLGHARALAALDNAAQIDLAFECIDEKWSVRRLEARIRGDDVTALPASQPREWQRYYQELGESVGDQTGYPCQLRTDHDNERAGYLMLRFTTLAELEGILDRLRVRRAEE